MQESKLLKVRETAKLLRVHPKHVYRLLKKGLPARKIGGSWRFLAAEVLQWAKRQKIGSPIDVRPPTLLAANGDLAVELLLKDLRRGEVVWGFVQADHSSARDYLDNQSVLVAGMHGGTATSDMADTPMTYIHLANREIGLVLARGKKLPGYEALMNMRFASRPATAGVRKHWDKILTQQGISSEQFHKTSTLYDSHREVVCAVASGRAEAGLTSRAWAERLDLQFFPLLEESYDLLLETDNLKLPQVVRMCETLQSTSFCKLLRAVGGYQTEHTGRIQLQAASH